jgi:hypothetical protein
MALEFMNIYLDIDGVILANDKQPALHAPDFITCAVNNFPVYWLTTHCRNIGDDPLPMLSNFFSMDTLVYLKRIKPTQWDTLKTEAIDFAQPFLWFDDDPLASEREVLNRRGVLDSWREVDLAKDQNLLQKEIEVLTKFMQTQSYEK